MCGRYRLSRRKQIIEEHFETADWQEDWSPRFNVALTQPVPVIRQNPKEPIRELSLMRWGLIPPWAKNSLIATGTINAKSETAASKPGISRSSKIPQVPDSGRWVQRVVADGKSEAAVLFRG
jgi:putative SOS response-associated peptidase YedK